MVLHVTKKTHRNRQRRSLKPNENTSLWLLNNIFHLRKNEREEFGHVNLKDRGREVGTVIYVVQRVTPLSIAKFREGNRTSEQSSKVVRLQEATRVLNRKKDCTELACVVFSGIPRHIVSILEVVSKFVRFGVPVEDLSFTKPPRVRESRHKQVDTLPRKCRSKMVLGFVRPGATTENKLSATLDVVIKDF